MKAAILHFGARICAVAISNSVQYVLNILVYVIWDLQLVLLYPEERQKYGHIIPFEE